MTTVSLLEFRKQADTILSRVRRGQSLLLTRRGKPVARLEPVSDADVSADDPIYTLAHLATDRETTLANADMDRAIYGTCGTCICAKR